MAKTGDKKRPAMKRGASSPKKIESSADSKGGNQDIKPAAKRENGKSSQVDITRAAHVPGYPRADWIKAQFVMPPDLNMELDRLRLDIKYSVPREIKQWVTRSSIVQAAVEMAIEDYRSKGEKGAFFKRLEKDIS